MVDLRLLAIFALAIGCTHTAAVSGELLDKRSDEPLAGAEVMIMRSIAPIYPNLPGEGFAYHWTTTDAQGRFAIPSHCDREPRPFSPYYRVLRGAILWIYHPELGYFIEFLPKDARAWKEVRIAVEPDRFSLHGLEYPELACDNLSKEGYRHCCEVVGGKCP